MTGFYHKSSSDRLMASFDSPSGIPYSDVNLKTRTGHAPKWSPDSSTSEVTTIQLEFRDLSRITGNSKYEEAVSRVSQHVHKLPKTHGKFFHRPSCILCDSPSLKVWSPSSSMPTMVSSDHLAQSRSGQEGTPTMNIF